MSTTERRVYLGLTIAAAVAAVLGLGWAANAYIGRQVDARMRDTRPIYTLECRPKENG